MRIDNMRALMFILFAGILFSCKDDNEVATGTEFPEEFRAVWEADPSNDPEFMDEDGGTFIHFESDTATFYGRVGDKDDPFCFVTAPLYEIISYEGNTFTLNILGLEKTTHGELTIEVEGDVMKWIISKNDTDLWNKTDEEASTFVPACDVELKNKVLSKFQSLKQ